MNMKGYLFALGFALAGALTLWSVVAQNWEFLIYAVVALVLVVALYRADQHVHFAPWTIALFDVWLVMHIAGGLVSVGDGALYAWVIVPLVGSPYDLLKYDQVVHTFCYFVVALLLWQASARLFRTDASFAARAALVVIAAVGIGAGNEIVEFAATVLVPGTGVGGYVNNALDLVANTIGALVAVPFMSSLSNRSRT